VDSPVEIRLSNYVRGNLNSTLSTKKPPLLVSVVVHAIYNIYVDRGRNIPELI
jgi:hypothetical protein